jgi:hypothetical protein
MIVVVWTLREGACGASFDEDASDREKAHFGQQLRGAHIITCKEYKEIPELTAADFARGTLAVCDRSRAGFRAAVAKVIRAWSQGARHGRQIRRPARGRTETDQTVITIDKAKGRKT